MKVVLASINDLGRAVIPELAKRCELAAVFTVKERGNLYMDISNFDDIAKEYNVPLYKISDINCQEVEDLIKEMNPDLGMFVGWNQILKRNILSIPRYGWLGTHPTRLPTEGFELDPKISSAGGNEPVPYTILKGFEKTALSFFWVEPKVDTGSIFAQVDVDLDTEHETTETLLDKLAEAAKEVVRDVFPSIEQGNPPRIAQKLGINDYYPPMNADDHKIDLSKPIEETYRLIRTCIHPYPNAYIEFGGERIYIENARLENGAFKDVKVRVGGGPYAKRT